VIFYYLNSKIANLWCHVVLNLFKVIISALFVKEFARQDLVHYLHRFQQQRQAALRLSLLPFPESPNNCVKKLILVEVFFKLVLVELVSQVADHKTCL
jgi:hypothetical protein